MLAASTLLFASCLDTEPLGSTKTEDQKNEKKWSVLDEHMVEKGADMQNWDTKEESSDNWDDDVDL